MKKQTLSVKEQYSKDVEDLKEAKAINKSQEEVVRLLKEATPKYKLKNWTRGYIPEHYKRLNISRQEAFRLAVIGAREALTYFQVNLHFTQAMLFGAVVEGYDTIYAITTSQYGKSWTLGMIAIYRAYKGHQVRIAAATGETATIIMSKVIGHLQNADESIQSSVLDSGNKIEKLQTSTSKTKISFKGGGCVEIVTLGGNSVDPKKNNNAIGKGGDYIIDEAAQVSEDAYAEIGRREFSSVDGSKELEIAISNPHKRGEFYDCMTNDKYPEGTLVVWMDVRTAYEEDRMKSASQILNSHFYKNRSTCQRYLVCELEEFSDESMFKTMTLDDDKDDSSYKKRFFLGVDSAYTGKDGIDVALCSQNRYGNCKIETIYNLKEGVWVQGVTSEKIITKIVKIIETLNVKYVCVDVGFGTWLTEGLSKYSDKLGFILEGVNFQGGPTKARIKARHYSAAYAFNLRAEMYLDFQQLMDSKKLTFTTEVAKKLKPELLATRTVSKNNKKIAIIPKEEIKQRLGHSPDALDSSVLSVRSCLMYNLSGEILAYAEND